MRTLPWRREDGSYATRVAQPGPNYPAPFEFTVCLANSPTGGRDSEFTAEKFFPEGTPRHEASAAVYQVRHSALTGLVLPPGSEHYQRCVRKKLIELRN